jgi:two-component system, LuxR family, response regulator FixJ
MFVAKKHIYIIDDDISVGRALEILLSGYEYKVKRFTSADLFFSAAPVCVPGCLILDVHMPGVDGWEIQQRLSRTWSKQPIIFISADKSGGLKERALQAGAVGFLQKPFAAQDLVNLLHLAFAPKSKMKP